VNPTKATSKVGFVEPATQISHIKH